MQVFWHKLAIKTNYIIDAENPQRLTALGAFQHPRDVVGVVFLKILSWSFIAPRRITSSQNYRKTDRCSLARGPNFSPIWKQFGHSSGVTTLAMDASTTMLSTSRPSSAVASWSRRISFAERTVRDRSVCFLSVEREKERKMWYPSSQREETIRDFASVFCSRDDVRPEGRKSTVTLLPLPGRKIFRLLLGSVDGQRWHERKTTCKIDCADYELFRWP